MTQKHFTGTRYELKCVQNASVVHDYTGLRSKFEVISFIFVSFYAEVIKKNGVKANG